VTREISWVVKYISRGRENYNFNLVDVGFYSLQSGRTDTWSYRP